eukprot:CAMPEP_0198595154 /NCGR_PEP_ID=MMETSP1462-20131121/141517_1 /TAXON_ID=1333877 /ORGANISM="Brandtodinium nutriculum, Strain RCC3387" /LENGTH=60 /DNA_ID=CAMNT_0044326783 /DNA_START=114 /DNA_END=293 /DNA_ORIENTATION=-
MVPAFLDLSHKTTWTLSTSSSESITSSAPGKSRLASGASCRRRFLAGAGSTSTCSSPSAT